MARHPRLFIPGATYHVYCRVARGEFVFDDPVEADGFVSAVRDVRDLDGWRILAWVLLSNHYHLVVKTDTVPLWRTMLRLQSTIAREFNRRHRYLSWIRQVAEMRWIEQGIRELPWWKTADNLDEIASPITHPDARTFDDQTLEDERVGINVEEFTALFERHSGHTIEALRSPLRHPQQVRARIEFATVAAARYGIRSTDIADSIRKHPTTIARLIGRGTSLLLEDPSFRHRIDSLDHRISSSVRHDPRTP